MAFEHETGGEQLQSIFYSLNQYGLLDFLLPALLIFLVVFGILNRLKLFTSKKTVNNAQVDVPDKKINGVLAGVISALIVVPHVVGLYPDYIDPILLIYKFLPNTGVLLVAIMAVVLLLGIAGVHTKDKEVSSFQMLLGIVAAIILVVVFMVNVFPDFFPWFDWLSHPQYYGPLIVIAVVVLIIYLVFREGGGQPAYKTIRPWMSMPAPATPPARRR